MRARRDVGTRVDSRFSFWEPYAQGAILACDKDFIEGKVSYTYTRKILPLLDMIITINLFTLQ
jgi:hypothetical protein